MPRGRSRRTRSGSGASSCITGGGIPASWARATRCSACRRSGSMASHRRDALCAIMMYGSGLRVLECVSLRVKDIDLDRHEIIVRHGKGGKDRRTPLPDRCVGPMRKWMAVRERAHPVDRRAGVRVTGLAEPTPRDSPSASPTTRCGIRSPRTCSRWRMPSPAVSGMTRSAAHATSCLDQAGFRCRLDSIGRVGMRAFGVITTLSN